MGDKPKLTIVTGPLLPVPAVHGGAVHRMWEHLAPALNAQGWNTTVCARCWPGQATSEILHGVHYQRWGGFAQSTRTILNLLRDLPYAYQLARRLPQAEMLIVNDLLLPPFAPASAGKILISVNRQPKRFQRWLWKSATALVAPSSAIADALRSEAPELTGRIHIIGNALPLTHFSNSNPSNSLRDLLYVGRLHPEKGVDIAIRAVRDLRTHGEHVRLTLVGPHATDAGGGGESYLRALKALAEDDPAITFHGPEFDTARLAMLYNSHGVFLYPSLAERGEALGVSPLEAMAAGCLPIVSELACFKDYLLPGLNGWSFAARGADSFTDLALHIRQAMKTTKDQHFRMSNAARSTASSYGIETIAKEWSDLMHSLNK